MRHLPRLLTALLATTLAAGAQADFVTSYQGVDFSYHGVDANTFTLQINGALSASGDWAPATNLGYLGFKNLGNLSGLTGVKVTLGQPSSSAVSWTYSLGELTGQGCNTQSQSGGICLDATPDLPLTDNLSFTIDLLGSGIDLSGVTGPHLKVGFSTWTAASGKAGTPGYKPAGYNIIGSLLSQDMVLQQTLPTDGGTSAGGGSPTASPLPEPASLALAGLALAGLAAARRRGRQRGD